MLFSLLSVKVCECFTCAVQDCFLSVLTTRLGLCSWLLRYVLWGHQYFVAICAGVFTASWLGLVSRFQYNVA